MQAVILLLLRFSTGSYLVMWGLIKLNAKESAVKVSEKYYAGILNGDIVNYSIGVFEVILGLLVVLGVFRRPVYIGQAIVYLVGLLAITPYILDPFALYWVSESRVTFYPSTTLFFASLVMLAFMSYDTYSIDHKRNKHK